MDIFATTDGKFAVGMLLNAEYKWNTDNTLSVWNKEPSFVNVTTNRGTFIEAIDKSGAVVASGGDGEFFYIAISKEPITIRYKALAKIALTKADLDKHRKIVTRYLLSDRPYSLNLPDTLLGMIKWFEKQVKAIPIASRPKARFRFDTTMEYGETYPHIEITYDEPETDNEIVDRLQIETERDRIINDKERATFRKLKSKFGAI